MSQTSKKNHSIRKFAKIKDHIRTILRVGMIVGQKWPKKSDIIYGRSLVEVYFSENMVISTR